MVFSRTSKNRGRGPPCVRKRSVDVCSMAGASKGLRYTSIGSQLLYPHVEPSPTISAMPELARADRAGRRANRRRSPPEVLHESSEPCLAKRKGVSVSG